MNGFSSLRVRLVGVVFLVLAPALAVLAFAKLHGLWPSICIGLLALASAWVGGEMFILRQVRSIHLAARKLSSGDLSARINLPHEPTELGELARSLDVMAEKMQHSIKEREASEASLLIRAHQQTVIAALGQFALVAGDLSTLLNQTVLLVSQTLEVDYCSILEFCPESKQLRLRAGNGWKDGCVGEAALDAHGDSQPACTLRSGEPVVVADMGKESNLENIPLFEEHGIKSGATVLIAGNQRPFGVLGVHSTRERFFTEEEVHFLHTVATLLAMSSERQRTEPEIQKLAAFAKFNPNPVLEFSSDGKLTYFNDATQKIATLLGETHPQAIVPPEAPKIVQTCLITGQARLQFETRTANRVLTWSFYPILASHVVHCYVEDITERISLEEQFRQIQKMESVGQLAAGVAHDFNNILTIIQGHSGLLMSRPNLSPAMTTSIQAVSFAAERASGLTRQLLMFSRKQVMQPRPIDLKDIVTNLSKMLQRLIGETITLQCRHPGMIPPVKGDPGMMEQVLMNLAVNARDAMPKGGQLIISTEHVAINEAHVRHHGNARPGNFVCLEVQDTGCGMDEATMKRIFEPFFTTKEAGRGTGLGLATVYGIVKQHNGWIEVNSRVGQGTTFIIYFPATSRTAESQTEIFVPTTYVRGGGETILVVEDEPVLLDLAQAILQDCGYNVLEAASGVDALTVWQKNGGAVDLLLTDMIMPDGLSGKDLAESLLGYKPNLKIIFTSGYNVEDLGGDLLQKKGFQFLQKPYTRLSLAKAVRDCLDN
jgi:signal transduction histidine kinase/CheY-like chemotaxis protein/HAMP domain-containing protein